MKVSYRSGGNSSKKVIDFAIGFFGWAVVNGVLLLIFILAVAHSYPSDAANGNKAVSEMLQFLAGVVLPFSFLGGNAVALVYFGRTRPWFCWGALSAFILGVLLIAISVGLLAVCVFFFCVP